MEGVYKLMEVLLITVASSAITLLFFITFLKPVKKTDLSKFISIEEYSRLLNENQAVKNIAINNEAKIQQLNVDQLNQIQKEAAEIEGLENQIDELQDHIARLRNSIDRIGKRSEQYEINLEKRVKELARPLLVKLIQDKSLRTYTIEKVRRTKTGYERKSLTRIVDKKKVSPIKKLNLPGVEASKDALVQSKL